jgi:hypothetical protein
VVVLLCKRQRRECQKHRNTAEIDRRMVAISKAEPERLEKSRSRLPKPMNFFKTISAVDILDLRLRTQDAEGFGLRARLYTGIGDACGAVSQVANISLIRELTHAASLQGTDEGRPFGMAKETGKKEGPPTIPSGTGRSPIYFRIVLPVAADGLCVCYLSTAIVARCAALAQAVSESRIDSST